MYDLILIDADDTLFDYQKAETYCLNQVFKKYNYEGDLHKIINRYKIINSKLWLDLEKGLTTKEVLRIERFKRLLEEFNLPYPVKEVADFYVENLKKCGFLLDDALELCQYLHSNYKLVIVTNGIKEVQLSRLALSPLKDYIHDIVISDDIGIDKPDPKIFEHALKLVNHSDKSTVIMIGDSLSSDIQGGINFGIDTCWFNLHKVHNTASVKAKYQITSLVELYDIL